MVNLRRTCPRRRPVRSTALVLLAASALAGCKRSEPTEASSPSAPSAPEPAKVAAAAAEFHEDFFDLAIRPAGPYSAGKAGAAEIVLSPKNGYHTNDKYPYKFKAAESHGVSFRAPVFTKEDVVLDEKRATMKLDFTPDSTGEKTVSGQFAFSVCSAEKCLVEKRDLTLRVAMN